MSRHSRTHRSAPDAEQTTLPASRPFSQPPKGLSPNPAQNAGHDFRQVSIFPTAAVQRKDDGGGRDMADVPVAGGGGEMIPDAVRAAMEASFAQDFGGVRIHTGPEARQVGALAYTRGNDLHFQPDRYDPFGDTGRHLLGHELTHVVQQRAGRVAAPRQNKSEGTAPINADAGLEAEADHQGAKAARGQRASVSGAGAGVQRKAEDAPIQRVEDEGEPKPKDIAAAKEIAEAKAAGKHYQMGAAPQPNEFLPSRLRPNQLVNASPERSQVRHNVNGTVFQPDVARVNTFRNRMAGEMTTQKNTLAQNDEAAQFPTHPLAKPGPGGWDKFQQEQRRERDKEIDALSEGKTTSKPNQSGIFERPEAVNNFTPRPAATRAVINPSKYVTAGTVAAQTPYKGGGGDTVTTRSGPANASRLGWLENRLNNPSQSTAFVDYQGPDRPPALRYPREAMSVRQEHLMKTAEKADPLMRELDNPAKNNTLDHHRDKGQRTLADNSLRAGDRITNMPQHGGRTLTDTAQKPFYAVGAPEFTNAQNPQKQKMQLPTLNAPLGPVNQANQNQSRPNVWSEADVSPTRVTNSWANNRRANVGPRDSERLLHTHPTSLQATQDGKGKATTTTSAPVDYRYHVTNDHYKTAVPVSPVAQGYKSNLPANHPYKSSSAEAPLATGVSGPARSSLNIHDNNEAKRIKQSAGDDNLLRFQASESLRDEAGQAAKQASRRSANKERRQANGAEFAVDQLAVRAGQEAEKSSSKRNADERDRVRWEGRYEDALPDKALADAQAASAKREAQEEARTQADLKALAPSEGAQAMYGMSARTARSVAERQMEMQHQAARAWTGGDHVGDAPSTARRPLSADAESMYG